MADWPIYSAGGKCEYLGGGSVETTSSNTLTAIYQITDSMPFTGILVGIINISTEYGPSCLCNLYIGGAGNEIAIANNLIVSHATDVDHLASNLYLPVVVQKGQRVSFNAQATHYPAWPSILLSAIPIGNTLGNVFAICDTLGAVTSDSGGTVVDPGGTTNTYGNWVEFTASTNHNYKGIIIGAGGQTNDDRQKSTTWILAIGYGASPDDSIVVEGCMFRCHSVGDSITPTYSAFFPVSIPKGVSLSVKAKCNKNDATDRLIDIILYCFV